MQANRASLSAPAKPSASQIFVRYVLFAVVAGAANLVSQAATARAPPMLPPMVTLLVGTVVGFIVKYVPDKKWIFQDTFARNLEGAQKVAKYAGAGLGLAFGNWIKYLPDRRYTFRWCAG